MARKLAPYHFVPIEPDLALHGDRCGHDRLDLQERWSGEIRCELTALTPLLAANDQYDLKVASDEVKDAFCKLVEDRAGRRPSDAVVNSKKVLEPLTLPGNGNAPGSVLIGPGQLKGMFRNSLSALFSAPIERVAERTFSYRPNTFLASGNGVTLRPALVTVRKPANGGVTHLEVELAAPGPFVFVRDDALPTLAKYLPGFDPGDRARGADWEPRELAEIVEGVELASERNGYVTKLRHQAAGREDLNGYWLVRYWGGVTGDGLFAQAHADKEEEEPAKYGWLLIRRAAASERRSDSVPQEVVRFYRETLEHLVDKDVGHLNDHPKIKKENSTVTIKQAWERMDLFAGHHPRTGDVVFVEVAAGTIVTLGHHFRYRWRYSDSIVFRGTDRSRPRAIMRPTEREHSGAGELTAARLLHGFVSTGTGRFSVNDPHVYGLPGSDGDEHALAGRLSFNMAIEQDASHSLRARFQNSESACLVPLKILANPKPSAVEHYLHQDSASLKRRGDGGTLVTYGDEPAQSGGELRGRKQYLHQPAAATDPRLFELRPGEGMPDWVVGSNPPKLAIESQQAAIGRYISSCGRRFCFTLRCRELDFWELGAILLALATDDDIIRAFVENLPEDDRALLPKWLNAPTESQPLIAHKLGHGRPLGLGSTSIRVVEMKRLQVSSALAIDLVLQERASATHMAMKALIAHLQDELADRLRDWVSRVFVPWLEVRRWQRERRRLTYPRVQGEITKYHGAVRRPHLTGRKHRAGATPEPSGLPNVEEIP